MLHGGQHAVVRAERMGEADVAPFDRGGLEGLLEAALLLVEFARVGALEREDRLLVVADREDRTRERAARARTDREFGHEALDDVPLVRARVLGLVDQEVIDAEVELVVDPCRADAREQVARLGDEVVVVEQAARLLFGAIARDHGAGERQQCAGAGAGDDRAAAIEQSADAALLVHEARTEVRVLVAEPLGDDVRFRRAFGRAEDGKQRREALRARRGPHRRQALRLLTVGFRSLRENRDQGRPFGWRNVRSLEQVVLDALDRVVGARCRAPATARPSRRRCRRRVRAIR